MSPKIAVYQLRSKFVNQRVDVPDEAHQVVYYSMAVGHHVGVMDCFTSQIEIPFDEYTAWVGHLPPGPARAKLEGVIRWGEIEVNLSHNEMLRPFFASVRAEDPGWTRQFLECLDAMEQEPAMYLMVRKVL